MYIKQVRISGFRSFRSQNEMDPFCQGHNVVVGRNGTGKSNFFDAIEFVLLSERFSNLRQEDRKALLHEGAGASVLSAFVELVLDNADGRLPQDTEEVILRRTIGLKKDEFFVNRKRVTKAEITSIFESAGFSKSNPYYIVQQGKVSHLCLMKDTDRLDLLKEVAGTKVYEVRREESVKIMQDTSKKREKIQEMLNHIEERLEELEGEKEELFAYEALIKKKKAMEYILYDKELKESMKDLDTLEIEREKDLEKIREYHDEADRLQIEIETKSRMVERILVEEMNLDHEKQNLEEDRMKLLQEKMSKQVTIEDVKQSRATRERDRKKYEEMLTHINSQLEEARVKLNEIDPQYQEAKSKAENTEMMIQMNRDRIEQLYEKLDHGSMYSSIEERDATLRHQMKDLQKSIQAKKEELEAHREGISHMEKQLGQLKKRQANLEKEHTKQREEFKTARRRVQESVKERNDTSDLRKESWRALESVNDKIQEERENLRRYERDLRVSMPIHLRDGLEAIKTYVEKNNIPGYYGPVIENFRLRHPKFQIATEVAAGNALFHVIVDNDETAARLMTYLQKKKAGRLTFMPLDKVHVDELHYPKTQDVLPLIDHAISYDEKMDKAMRYVFGRKLIARNLEVAAFFSKEVDMDAVTLEGDEVNRKGSMKGGYYDEQTIRLACYSNMQKSKTTLEECQAEYMKLKRKSEEEDQRVTRAIGKIQSASSEEEKARARLEEINRDLGLLKREIRTQSDLLISKKRSEPSLESEIASDESKKEALEKQLGTPLQTALSDEEQDMVARCNQEIQQLRRQLDTESEELEKISSLRQEQELLISTKLGKRKDDIEAALEELSHADSGDDDELTVQGHEVEYARVCDLFEDVNHRYEKCLENIATCSSRQKEYQSEVENMRAVETSFMEKLNDATKRMEVYVNRKAVLTGKINENTKNIQDLGSLPSGELDHHRNKSIRSLLKEIKSVNTKLKEYDHVNKKAMDQFVNFSEQRSDLLSRKKELDDGASSIESLIEQLDMQKDEAIQRTFRGVSRHFQEVFAELVPSGHGQLILKTKLDDDFNPIEDGDGRIPVDDFVGVQVKVSFSKSGECYLMKQLSGGQKALVALALIFAIQRCDPAPFYLFDEIDQALDSSYRAQVAALIQRQAEDAQNPAQFITSTFRPELVQVAKKFYGISHQGKISNIHRLSKEDALDFISNLMQQEAVVDEENIPPGNYTEMNVGEDQHVSHNQ